MSYDICIAAGAYNKMGGIERYNVELVHALAQEGHRIHLIVTQVGYDTSNVDEVTWIRIDLFFRPLTTLVRAVKSSILYFKFKREHPNGIFISDGLPSFFADIVIAQSVHRESVLATNTREPKTPKGLLRRFLRSIYPMNVALIVIEWFSTVFGAKMIVAISQKVKREILKVYRVRAEKIAVVYSAVNSEEFRVDTVTRASVRREAGFGEHDFVFLFSGHEFKRKGLRYAVAAFSKLRSTNTRLLVAGKDKSEVMRQVVKDLRLGDRVSFIGPRNDFPAWCAAADAFVFPTLEDAFGLVIVEAMASGLPVITSGPAYAGAAECLKDGIDAILLDDPTDVEEMAAEMGRLVKDERFRASLGANARKTALGLSWDRTARGIVGAWKSRTK